MRHLVPEHDERLEATEANLGVDVDMAPHATGPEGDGLLDEPPCPLRDRHFDLAPDRLLRLDPLGHPSPPTVRDPAGAEQGLVEVHVALDQRGQKERAADVHVLPRLGRPPGRSDRRDPTVLAEHVDPSAARNAGVRQGEPPAAVSVRAHGGIIGHRGDGGPSPPYNRARPAKEDEPWRN